MIIVREYKENDFEQIKTMDMMMALSLKWNKAYHKEDAYVATIDGEIVGAGALAYDATWYYLNENRTDIPRYRMNLSVTAKEDSEQFEEILGVLVDELKNKMNEYRKQYPDKNLEISSFVENTELEEMAFYLHKGFVSHNVIWVLGFDLTKDIPQYDIPKNITIGLHNFDGNGMEEYFIGNEAGFGLRDSEDELRFNLTGPSTEVFTAKDGNKVVSAATIWGIGNGRSATENIFTVPEYRHQNIARATLAYALQALKDKGETLATLSCAGDNLPAITMYQSMGYTLNYFLVEMCDQKQ